VDENRSSSDSFVQVVRTVREVGQKDGSILADRNAGLTAALSFARTSLDVLTAAKRTEVITANGRAEVEAARSETAASHAARCHEELMRIRNERDNSPVDFSLIKGSLYVLLSVLVLVADMAILGEVFGAVLNAEFYFENKSFVTLLLTDPGQAFKLSPALLVLMIAVLVMGMALKLARDHFGSVRASSGPLRRLENLVVIAFVLASVLVVAIVALVRYQTPLAQGSAPDPTATVGATNEVIQILSAALGLFLPFISAVYFIKGYEQIANRLRLFTRWALHWLALMHFRRATRKAALARAQCEQVQQELAVYERPGSFEKLLDEVRAGYRTGYAEGVFGVISVSHSLLDVIRTRLVSRHIAEAP
jgi:hypothetical protein